MCSCSKSWKIFFFPLRFLTSLPLWPRPLPAAVLSAARLGRGTAGSSLCWELWWVPAAPGPSEPTGTQCNQHRAAHGLLPPRIKNLKISQIIIFLVRYAWSYQLLRCHLRYLWILKFHEPTAAGSSRIGVGLCLCPAAFCSETLPCFRHRMRETSWRGPRGTLPSAMKVLCSGSYLHRVTFVSDRVLWKWWKCFVLGDKRGNE